MRRTAFLVATALLCVRTAQGQLFAPYQPPASPAASPTPSGVQPYQASRPAAEAPRPQPDPTHTYPGVSWTYQNGMRTYTDLPSTSAPSPTNPAPGMPTLGATRIQFDNPGGLPPGSVSALPDNRVTFDPQTADLQWANNHWVLMAGNVYLKDFGNRESEGREALHLIQALNLNELGRVGSPKPVMEYWLTNGQAPVASNLGPRVVPLNPANLRIDEFQGQWCVRNNSRVLFAFPSEDDARQALSVIRKYGFTQVGYVGQGMPSMLVFLGGGAEAMRDSRMITPLPIQPRMVTPGSQSSPFGQQGQAQGLLPVQYLEGNAGPTLAHAGQTSPAGLQVVDLRHSITQPYDPARMGAAATPGAMTGRPLTGTNAPAVQQKNPQAEVIPFDYRQAQVRLDHGEWKLVNGAHTLATFGTNQQDAQTAQMVLQHYHCTEQVLIGRPPLFSFYLVGGQAPHGAMTGLEGVHFDPATLSVRQQSAGWALCAGANVLVQFGADLEDANHTLDSIKRQHFDLLCRIGHGQGTGMTFLVRTR